MIDTDGDNQDMSFCKIIMFIPVLATQNDYPFPFSKFTTFSVQFDTLDNQVLISVCEFLLSSISQASK